MIPSVVVSPLLRRLLCRRSLFYEVRPGSIGVHLDPPPDLPRLDLVELSVVPLGPGPGLPQPQPMHPQVSHLLQFFEFAHLPGNLQQISVRFRETACWVADNLEGPEATVCLRKLLEAKDCAVRAGLGTAELPKNPVPDLIVRDPAGVGYDRVSFSGVWFDKHPGGCEYPLSVLDRERGRYCRFCGALEDTTPEVVCAAGGQQGGLS